MSIRTTGYYAQPLSGASRPSLGHGAVARRRSAPARSLPPWLLHGYGAADGGKWPSGGAASESQAHLRHWKRSSDTAVKELWAKGSISITKDTDVLSADVLLELAAQQQQRVDQQLQQQQQQAGGGPHDCVRAGCRRVVINVSGQRYETQLRTLNRFPSTLLGNPARRRGFWDERRHEYFLDRHRPTFQAILYYYQSGGRLRRPIEVPEDVFLDELEFYELGDDVVELYKEKEGFLPLEKGIQLPELDWQRRIWLFCEEPNSNIAARCFAIISVICILVSVVNFCMETLPYFERPICVNVTSSVDDSLEPYLQPNYADPFLLVESICVTWFTVEFILRLVSCPSKRAFCRGIMNIFDALAILPFFVILVVQQTEGNCESAKKSGSLIFIRVLRVFRIFKLSKHSQGLRILGLTIKTSIRELGMFFFFLIVAMVIFSSAVYYAEAGEPDTQLTSIPGAFWWAIVTMTTVGYGDVTPQGIWGKLVGTLCVIAGVLTIALPVPVVVANFNNFYRHDN